MVEVTGEVAGPDVLARFRTTSMKPFAAKAG